MHDPRVRLLGRGEANINYIAEDTENQYVIRTMRNDVPGHSRFEAEHHYMLFIESLGIRFAPRSIHFDPGHDVHIVSYVEGKDVSVADLDDSLMRLFVEQIKALNQITYHQYLDWCHNSGQPPREPVTLETRTKINITDRLQTIQNSAEGNDFAKNVLEWADPKVEILYKAGREAPLKMTFLHNDLRWNEGGGNLKICDNKLVFIDWELAGFFEAAAPEIGDVLGSIPSSIPDQSMVSKLYQMYMANEKDADQLNKSIRYGILWGKLGNPLWAAERYFVLSKNNHPDAERYRHLTEQGMRDAERFFKQSFEQWFNDL